MAVTAHAYVLRDSDPRTEEIKASLPEARAPTAAVSKAVNVDDVKDLVAAKAAAHGVPGELARAVVQVESDYDVDMTGSVGEVGLMQIKYETARLLGYTGTLWELYEPETNIEWGMRYLAGARRLADGDLCGTVMRYNGGHGRKQMSRATTIYCNKVKRVLGLSPDPVPTTDPRDDRKDVVARAPVKKDQSRLVETAAKQDKPTVVKLAAAPAIVERKIARPARPVHHTPYDEPDMPDFRVALHGAHERSFERKLAITETSHRANVVGPFTLADAFAETPAPHARPAAPKHETAMRTKPVALAAKIRPAPTAATTTFETAAAQPDETAAKARPVGPALKTRFVAPAKPRPVETAAKTTPVEPAETTAAITVAPAQHATVVEPNHETAAPAKPVAPAKTRLVGPAKLRPEVAAVKTTPVAPAQQATVVEPSDETAAPAKPVAPAKTRLVGPAKPRPMVAAAKTTPVAPAQHAIVVEPSHDDTAAPAKPVAPAKTRLVAPAKPKPVETAADTTTVEPVEPADTAAATAAITVVGKTRPAKTAGRKQSTGDGLQAPSELVLGGGVARGDRLRIADHGAE